MSAEPASSDETVPESGSISGGVSVAELEQILGDLYAAPSLEEAA